MSTTPIAFIGISPLELLIVGVLSLVILAPIVLLLILLIGKAKWRSVGLSVLGVLAVIGGLLFLMLLVSLWTYRTGSMSAQYGEVNVYPKKRVVPYSDQFMIEPGIRQNTQHDGGAASIHRDKYEEQMAELNGQTLPAAAAESTSDTATENESTSEDGSFTESSAEETSEEPSSGDAEQSDPSITATDSVTTGDSEASTDTAAESEGSAEETSKDSEATKPPATSPAPKAPPEYPSGTKPKWVASPPKRVGNSYQRVIRSDPFTTVEECNRQLDNMMIFATAEYLDQLIGTDRYSRSPQYHMPRLGVNKHYIRQQFCKDEHVETLQASVGSMKQVYILMEFDADAQRDLQRRWKDSELTGRLAAVGAGSVFVLLLVGMTFGFFKLDTATKGFYTKRLIFGAIAVTMGLSFGTVCLIDELLAYY